MKMFEPKVDPAPQSRGDLLHHLQQFSRPKSLQKAGIFRPELFGLPNQPGPGAYRLPVELTFMPTDQLFPACPLEPIRA